MLKKDTPVILESGLTGTVEKITLSMDPDVPDFYSYHVRCDNGELAVVGERRIKVFKAAAIAPTVYDREPGTIDKPNYTVPSEETPAPTDKPVYTAVPDHIDKTVYPAGITPPFKNYPGNKGLAGLYQKIISLMPPHDIYIEPFLGQGEIFCRKKPARINIGNDINPTVAMAWNKFRDLPKFEFFNVDANVLIADYWGWKEKILIYADPPYLKSSRRSPKDIYVYEMTPEQHNKFLDLATACKHYVIISCYDNDLYRERLAGWNKTECNVMTHGGKAVETVYYNFDDTALTVIHDYSHLGKNFTDRQRIKRKVQRWCNKFGNLPFLEQSLIFDELEKKRPH